MDREEIMEKKFEADIEQYLLTEGGYTKGTQATYDKELAMDLDTLISFFKLTQLNAWNRFEKKYGGGSKKQLYKTVQGDIVRYGLIYVLRNGIDDFGIKLKLCYFAPASELNEELVQKYQQNILTCTRQFTYSANNRNTIDMVLSLNGIPVIAIELKNQFTGQSVENSKRQWREDRNPKELLFHFNKRILAYFGIDLYEAAVTTELKGEKTFFIPFNQGSNGAGKVGGAGNPKREDSGYVTSYIWENVLRKDMLLAILQRYVMVQEEKKLSIIVDKHGKEKEVTDTSTKLIFPRYHQLDIVEKLVTDTVEKGSGNNYLIQHSAGSGKSNSIAWLTYRLASLHRHDNKNVFDGVFVITDRRVLNKQLQDTILGFEHIDGTIETITDKDNSDKLRQVIDDGVARIVITTLHRFPIIYNKLAASSGKRYAIIVDEAHSSQSGKSAEKLKAALADTDMALQEMAELEGKTEEELENDKDAMMEDLLAQGQHENLSFYAFTATPKPKTLQTFGVLSERGDCPENDSYKAFHNYSMLQAIEEGFIKDVLKCYTTFDTTYEIAKQVQENPEYEETPATRALKAFHDNHEDTVNKKCAIIVEKFREVTLNQMEGKAKAMVVTASRAHAVRYFMAIKKYCKDHNITDVNPMVAFSGKVEYAGKEYTESMLNSVPERKITEDRLPLYFSSDLYNMLIVADKYQTGFDEPMLHTMFVDKKLKNVKAVQTLSRLNRWQKDKKDTYVFDFVNNTEEIKKSFEPFYQDTELIKPVDVNFVYTFRKDIEMYRLWTIADEEAFYKIISDIKKTKGDSRLAALSNAFKPVLDRIAELEEEKQFEVRNKIKNFIRFYSYMAQIARTFDKSLYKAYVFADYLYRVIPKTPHEKVDLTKQVLLINSKIEAGDMVSIQLGDEKPKLKGENPKGAGMPEEKKDLLDNIIDKVNIMYQGDFSPADRVMVEGIIDHIQKLATAKIKKQAAGNDENQFVDGVFGGIFDQAAQDCYVKHTDAFRKLFENQEFYQILRQQIGHYMYNNYKSEEAKYYTLENLEKKLLSKQIRAEFEGIKGSARTLEEAFEWMIRVIHSKAIEKYNGLEEVVLDPLFKLFCYPGKLTNSEKRLNVKGLATSYESYLKKLYYLVSGNEATDKNGNVDRAALSNALYATKLNLLKYSNDETDKRFSKHIDDLMDYRNKEAHNAKSITPEDVEEAMHISATLYLYVTYRYITDLEMNEDRVDGVAVADQEQLTEASPQVYATLKKDLNILYDGMDASPKMAIAAEPVDVEILSEEGRIDLLKKAIVKLLGYDTKKSAFSKQRQWQSIYRVAVDKGFVSEGDYTNFKAMIDSMDIPNLPTSFSANLIKKYNVGTYAQNLSEWIADGFEGKLLQEYRDIKVCAVEFDRILEALLSGKEK